MDYNKGHDGMIMLNNYNEKEVMMQVHAHNEFHRQQKKPQIFENIQVLEMPEITSNYEFWLFPMKQVANRT